MTQMSFFGPKEAGPDPKPASDELVRLKLIVTVKAAPNPSERYGETVCVAGLSTDYQRRGWLRLYPINFRELESEGKFKKYDVISVDARPAREDQRRESWKPIMATIKTEGHLKPWEPRRTWLEPFVEDSMCRLNRNARANANAQSLALVRPQDISKLEIEEHPGWSRDEQHKIDMYVRQLDLLSTQERTPLEPPRFKGFYRYRCGDRRCGGHRQGLLDWEFVAFQRNRLAALPEEAARQALVDKFLGQLCAPDRDVAFYVGNQAKRAHVFSVLGVYWPKR
ncbi:hypothetical protein [Micromonospora sp. NPDC005299]|uniref:hypothetical protein n=1 Tax=Micromonospora sp. NPDC005299 TaxID=3364231 RepID=UPI003673F9CC